MKQEVNFRLSACRYNETTYILNVKLIVSSWCYIDALLQLSWRWEWDCEREWDERGNLTAAREQAWRSKIAVQYATTERVGRTPGNWENNDEVRWLIEHLHTFSSGDLRRHKLANQLSHRLASCHLNTPARRQGMSEITTGRVHPRVGSKIPENGPRLFISAQEYNWIITKQK